MTSYLSIPTAWIAPSLRYRVSVTARTVVPWAALMIAGVVFTVLAPLLLPSQVPYLSYVPFALLGLLALALFTGGSALLGALSIRYQLTDTEIAMRAGVLSRVSTSLSYQRIQTVTLQNGVIDRLLGITNITCQSAADQSSIVLPGLREADAEQIRAEITERVRAYQMPR